MKRIILTDNVAKPDVERGRGIIVVGDVDISKVENLKIGWVTMVNTVNNIVAQSVMTVIILALIGIPFPDR